VSQGIADTFGHLLRAARQRSLYPDGHPVCAAAEAGAYTAVRDLLLESERVEFLLAEEGVLCEGEPVVTGDDSLQELARTLRQDGIWGLGVRRGITDSELDLLLDLLGPQHMGAGATDIAARLRDLGAECLRVVTVCADQIVPRSRAGQAVDRDAVRDIQALRELVARTLEAEELAGGGAAGTFQGLLDHSLLAAEALFDMVGSDTPGSDDDRPEARGAPAEDENYLPLRIGNTRIERLDVSVTAIALAAQRIGEIADALEPARRAETMRRLADALRQFAPDQLACILQTNVVGAEGSCDVLGEVAQHFSTEEVIALFRAQAADVVLQSSVVVRRLLARVAPTIERLHELLPGIKEALLQAGVSESAFEASVGQVAERLLIDEVGAAQLGTPDVSYARPAEALRAERRAQLAPLLDAAGDPWRDRATVCLELMEQCRTPGQLTSILDALLESLPRVPPAEGDRMVEQAVKALAEVCRLSSERSDLVRAEAKSRLTELLAGRQPAWLQSALQQAAGPDRAVYLAALARAGPWGRRVLLDSLRTRALNAEGDEVSEIVRELLEASGGEAGPDAACTDSAPDGSAVGRETGLVDLIVGLACADPSALINALVAQGGPTAAKCLMDLLHRGDFGVRCAVVQALDQPRGPLLQVAVIALDDAELEIACLAARALGQSGEPDAARGLMRLLPSSNPFDPRLPLRVAAAIALGDLRHQGAVAALAEIVKRPAWVRRAENDQFRVAAARALRKIGTFTAWCALASRAKGERCPEIQALAWEASEHLKLLTTQASPREEVAAHGDGS
jgi:hypothetical protein